MHLCTLIGQRPWALVTLEMENSRLIPVHGPLHDSVPLAGEFLTRHRYQGPRRQPPLQADRVTPMPAQQTRHGQQRDLAHSISDEARLRQPIESNLLASTINYLSGTSERITRGISLNNGQAYLLLGTQGLLNQLLGRPLVDLSIHSSHRKGPHQNYRLKRPRTQKSQQSS